MKQFFFVLLFLLVCVRSYAINYYLSNSGSDSNNGTSPSDPWQTIDQLNSVPLQPGDSIFFECGSIFRGQISVISGGTDSAPIYFGKYGSGNLPVISGAEVVSGWTNYAVNIYQAPFTKTPAHLFADDKQMTIARYPNSGFLIQQNAIGGNLGFIDSFLIEPNGYWNGATIRIRTSDRTWDVVSVLSFSGDTILFQSPALNSLSGGHGYYFDNLFSLLDTSREWYYDIANQNLYFIAPGNVDPSLINVEASVYDYGIIIQNGSGHIAIQSIQFEKQRKSATYVELNSQNISIASCVLRLQGETGIRIPNGSGKCLITENIFSDINGIGISLGFAHNAIITKNILNRIGLIAGYGLFPSNNMMAIECNQSDSMFLSQNTIDSAGSCGIFAGMMSSVISKNILRNCLLNINALGSIYVYGLFNSASRFENNIILHSVGNIVSQPHVSLNAVGIYVDESATENILENNTIAYATCGILIAKNSSNNIIHHNVVYGCNESQIKFSEGAYQGGTVGNVVTGNTFYSLNESADVVKLSSTFNSFSPAYFDSNYYFNPYDFFAFHSIISTDTIPFEFYYTLSEWKRFSLQDLASKETFFFRDRYALQDIIGDELISNGEFTNNFDGWTNINPSSLLMLLDNSTPLDYGCMKLQRTDFTFGLPVEISSSSFPIDSGRFYFASFSCYSPTQNNVMLLQKTTQLPTLILDLIRTFPVDTIRKDYGVTFLSTKHHDGCKLDLLLRSNDTTVFVDNISIKEADVIFHDPEKLSRLFLNEDSIVKTFSLADSVFFNLDHNVVTGNLTLLPYSSTILIFDSSLILSNEILPQTSSRNEPFLFPSLTTSSGIEHLVFNDISSYDILLQLFSLEGTKVNEQSILKSGKQLSFSLPDNLTSGIYFLRINGNSKTYCRKIVVQ